MQDQQCLNSKGLQGKLDDFESLQDQLEDFVQKSNASNFGREADLQAWLEVIIDDVQQTLDAFEKIEKPRRRREILSDAKNEIIYVRPELQKITICKLGFGQLSYYERSIQAPPSGLDPKARYSKLIALTLGGGRCVQ